MEYPSKALLQQIILRSALDGKPRDILVAPMAQDQNRNVRPYAKQRLEGPDSLAIRQEKADHDRCDSSFSWVAQSFDSSRALTDPFDIEWTVT